MRERSHLSLFWGECFHLLSARLQRLRRDSSQQIFDFFLSPSFFRKLKISLG